MRFFDVFGPRRPSPGPGTVQKRLKRPNVDDDEDDDDDGGGGGGGGDDDDDDEEWAQGSPLKSAFHTVTHVKLAQDWLRSAKLMWLKTVVKKTQ